MYFKCITEFIKDFGSHTFVEIYFSQSNITVLKNLLVKYLAYNRDQHKGSSNRRIYKILHRIIKLILGSSEILL
jgi:hypothetical protein